MTMTGLVFSSWYLAACVYKVLMSGVGLVVRQAIIDRAAGIVRVSSRFIIWKGTPSVAAEADVWLHSVNRCDSEPSAWGQRDFLAKSWETL